jgi:hypothetical protein
MEPCYRVPFNIKMREGGLSISIILVDCVSQAVLASEALNPSL